MRKSSFLLKSSFLTICVFLLVNSFNCESSADLVNTKVERTIDLSSHLAYITNTITVENTGSGSLKSYTFLVEPLHAKHVSSVKAQVIILTLS